MRPEHLAYFKDLFDGRAQLGWHAWFARHDRELQQDLPRAAYLHLKFRKLDEAELKEMIGRMQGAGAPPVRRPEGTPKPEGDRRPDGEKKPEARRPDGEKKPEGDKKSDAAPKKE